MSFAARTGLGTTASTALGAYLKNASYFNAVTDPATSIVRFSAANTGYVTVTSGTPDYYNWLTGAGVAADYSIRLTLNSGDAINEAGSAPTGSWVSLVTTRYWGLSISGGYLTNNCTIEIAETADTTNILASAVVSMTSESLP